MGFCDVSDADTTDANVRSRGARMSFIRRWLGQPLIQFVLIGAAIFGLWKLQSGGEPANPSEIRIGAPELQWLHDTWAGQFGRPPTATEMQSAIDGYIDEEMRYREGLALGLDRDDSIIRRRLAQKYDFLLGTRASGLTPTEAELRAHHAGHPDRFSEPALSAFCQVYFGDGAQGLGTAEQALGALPPAGRRDPEALTRSLGELPYPRCSASASREDVLRDFGQFFAETLDRLPADDWQGPVESGYGFHLVFVKSRAPAKPLAFEAARASVEADWRAEKEREFRAQDDGALRERYRVNVDEDAVKKILAGDKP